MTHYYRNRNQQFIYFVTVNFKVLYVCHVILTFVTIDVTAWPIEITFDASSGKSCNIIQLLTYVEVDMECY